MSAARSFDIFCRVVDNHGDIGVCWRLARQLAGRTDCGHIRLWVDDLYSFARIAPEISPCAAEQALQGVRVLHWVDTPATNNLWPEPADVVIEAFACSPPPAYLARMSDRQLWINLEYLSAEEWVESCHGLPSVQPNGLRKFFFFPGFTAATGGLLREADLIAQRDAWQAEDANRLRLLHKLQVSADWLRRIEGGATLVYVYCYPQAPLPALMQALARQQRDALVLLPTGIWPQPLSGLRGDGWQVEAHCHPFVAQDDFDRLLWSSDFNIVRGEDSLLRAIWAGRAMLWQPYLQQDDAHLDKLDAWLKKSPYPADVAQVMQAWNRADTAAATEGLSALLGRERMKVWEARARNWCEALTKEDDLTTRLMDFCAIKSQTR